MVTKILGYVAAYLFTVTLLLLVNYILSQSRRDEADSEARLEVARWRSFLAPGADLYTLYPRQQSTEPTPTEPPVFIDAGQIPDERRRRVQLSGRSMDSVTRA